MLRVMGEDGARGKDWLRAWGASPVSYRHSFLGFFLLHRSCPGVMPLFRLYMNNLVNRISEELLRLGS